MMKDVVGACSLALALTAAASAQTPAGGEFRVNAYTTSRQVVARTAMEPDGNFVVVWTSFSQDGDRYGVFGRRFAASGAPRGSAFQVNTYTTDSQHYPAVAIASTGDFIVVWVSGQILNGFGENIRGQRFDAAGRAIGSEFQVNTFTTGFQAFPRVGRASDDSFVVSWTSQYGDGSFDGIAARRFAATGNPIGDEFVVNTVTAGRQHYGDVAVEPNGNFVVVWEDYDNGDGSDSAIVGQRYDASGTRVGGQFQVNSDTLGGQRRPSVSVSPAGAFVVAWRSTYGDGSGYGVFARVFDASGNAVGNDFVVNTYTTGDQSSPFGGAVAVDTRGNFVVTWTGPGDGTLADPTDTFGQRFSASGARRGEEFRVNTFTTSDQKIPSVASDASGNFVVVWQSQYQDGSDYGIFAQRFGRLGPHPLGFDGVASEGLGPDEKVPPPPP